MSLTPGLVKTPLVDESSRVTNPWAKYFESLENGTAVASVTVTDTSLLARLAAAENAIGNLQRRVRELELGVQM